MRQTRRQAKSGDSIIEVLLAVAIFSAIAVTSVAIMNKGLSSAQTALESTMVRTELDAQAEAIRFIEQAYETNAGGPIGSQWSTIIGKAISPDTSPGSDYNKLKTAIDGNNACLASTDLTGKYFLYKGSELESDINLSTSSIPSATNGGLWVVAVKNNNETEKKKIEYYDFYISACWDALNSPMPAKRTTIIRIHNPDYETAPGTPVTPAPGTPVTPDYSGKLTIKFQSGISSPSTDKWSLSGPSGFLKKDMSASESYDLEVLNEFWNDGQTPPNDSTFTFNDGNYSAKSEGWIFNGWSTTGNPTAGYTCQDTNLPASCEWNSNSNTDKAVVIYKANWVEPSKLIYESSHCSSLIPDSQEGENSEGWTTSVSSTPAKGSVCTEGTNVYVFDRWRGSDGKDYNPGASITIASGYTLKLTADWKSLGNNISNPISSETLEKTDGYLSIVMDYEIDHAGFLWTNRRYYYLDLLEDGDTINVCENYATMSGRISCLLSGKYGGASDGAKPYMKKQDGGVREVELIINSKKLDLNKEYTVEIKKEGRSDIYSGIPVKISHYKDGLSAGDLSDEFKANGDKVCKFMKIGTDDSYTIIVYR